MPDAKETEYTFKEVKISGRWPGFEIKSKSGARIMLCPCGEGSSAFPLGTVQLTKMLGGDKIRVFDPPIPLGDLFGDPGRLTPVDGAFYVYWIHPVDYAPVVRMLKELGAAHSRARPLRVGRHDGNSMVRLVDQKARANPIIKKALPDQF
jgi:hypothetical protein